jgi:thiol-disulfide isomerase/thioredoxin
MNALTTAKAKKWVWVAGLASMAFIFSLHHEIAFCSSANISQPPPQLGDRLPKISFPASLSPEEYKYLGLGQRKNFSLDDIKTKLILIDFIGINCHFCIQSMPTMNEIYKAVEKDQNLRANVKMLAVAAGGTPTEIDYFRKSFGVLFPILADPEYEAHESVGEPRVPFLIFARKDRQGKWVVVNTKVGLMGIAEARTATYLEEDVEVEKLEGDIVTLESFINELKTFLAIKPEALKSKTPSQ